MTWIIATVGQPKSYEYFVPFVEAKVGVVRFNFSHAEYSEVQENIATMKKISQDTGWNFLYLLDTKGPEIRTGDLSAPISYEAQEEFELVVDPEKRTGKMLYIDYPHLIEDVAIGGIIRIDSGLFDVEVLEKKSDSIRVRSLNSATIKSRRHVNLPNVTLRLPGLSDKDKQDVLFAIENNFTYIAMSFVRYKKDIDDLRDFLDKNNGSSLKIISKIENHDGINNIDEIIDATDLIMVARGDLWTELPYEMIPVYQMQILKKCKQKNTPVIVATHMLESMIDNPTPTRAEVNDVFWAVLQWADYVMLSGETAYGKYPKSAVTVMRTVIEQAEKYMA